MTQNQNATGPDGLVEPGGMSAFGSGEYAERQERLRRILKRENIDLLLVTGPENIFYLTGQQTPGYYTLQFLGIPVDGEPFMLLRQLEYYNAVSNTFINDITPYADNIDAAEALSGLLRDKGLAGKRIAVERTGWFLSVAAFDKIIRALGNLMDGSGLIEELRVIKSPAEIEALKAAAEYTDAGMRAGMSAVAAGSTENDVVAAMAGSAFAAGCEYMGMDPFVTSGPRSGVPHTTWRRRVLENGDAVLLEMAGCHNRYHAGLMRTVWIGPPPAEARAMMEACQDGLAAALDQIRPGNTCADVHNACQAIIDERGFTDGFKKRTGYAIGIAFAPDWGEGHILSLYHNVHTPLAPGMVFHMPPALRAYGRFCVGVSETVVVTESGYEALSRIDRTLLEV